MQRDLKEGRSISSSRSDKGAPVSSVLEHSQSNVEGGVLGDMVN